MTRVSPVRTEHSAPPPAERPPERIHARPLKPSRPRSAAHLALAAVAVAAYAMPLYLVVVNVFKKPEQVASSPASVPRPFTVDNVKDVFTSDNADMAATLIRTALITVSVMALVIFLGSALGYWISRNPGWVSRSLLLIMVLGLAVPFQVILVPVSQVLRAVGLMGSYPGLILFDAAYYTPFAVVLFARFLHGIPRDLDEAAALDGAGSVRVYTSIILPLLRPATASVMIFVAVWVWNDFVNPLVLLGPAQGTTIMTGLYRTLGQYTSNYGETFAFIFVASVPLLILFLLLQQRFVDGLTAGSTKG